MSLNTEFIALIDQSKDNLDYLSEGLLIDVTEQFLAQMEKRKITRAQLAKKMKCSNAYISKLLNGSENLTLKKLAQIAHVLDCTIDLAILPKYAEVKRYIKVNPPKNTEKPTRSKAKNASR